MKLIFVLSGHDVEMNNVDEKSTLIHVMGGALIMNGITPHAARFYEARTHEGVLLELPRKIVDFQWKDGTRIFLSTRPGFGG